MRPAAGFGTTRDGSKLVGQSRARQPAGLTRVPRDGSGPCRMNRGPAGRIWAPHYEPGSVGQSRAPRGKPGPSERIRAPRDESGPRDGSGPRGDGSGPAE